MVSAQPNARRVLLAVTLATLAIFGGLVAGITLNLREQLRAEVLRREAEAIHAVAQMQLGPAEERLSQFAAEFAIDDLFAAVLASSRLRGVLAVQLFDRSGALREAEPLAPEDAESTRWWTGSATEPLARFFPAGTLDLVSPKLAVENPTAGAMPLVEIAVPLRGSAAPGMSLGVARYWVNGGPVAAEFARMDRRLMTQAGVAFASGAVLIAVVLAWAFSRLGEANRRLLEQRADLARANEELDFAAKTGALGAISAHLIHGLKNPLAGLEGFVAENASAGANPGQGEAWRDAVETTRRLRAMVGEVSAVLADEAGGDGNHRVPLDEIVEAVRIRAASHAERAGVQLVCTSRPGVQLTARTGNLAGLVLANLLTNAIEACDGGGRVTLEAQPEKAQITFIVSDTGSGLPDAVRGALFRPVRSTKRGGGGVGLAISQRLAKHAGGELELVRSDASGTAFRLRVPVAS